MQLWKACLYTAMHCCLHNGHIQYCTYALSLSLPTRVPSLGARMMACEIVRLLEQQTTIERLGTMATPKKLADLKDKLRRGLQTEDDDHQIMCVALNLSLVIHNPPDYSSYTAFDAGADSDELHVRFTHRKDAGGNTEGHFDLLIPRNDDGDVSSLVAQDDPLTVKQAITLKGVELASAILSLQKEIENRNFCMEGAWYGLHIGKSDVDKDLKKLLQREIPNLDCKGLEKGFVVGLVYVEKSIPLQQYRASVGCTSAHCDFPSEGLPVHVDGCACSKHALGPILNFITKIARFHKPFPARGKLGKWPLSCEAVNTIKKILSEGSCTHLSAQIQARTFFLSALCHRVSLLMYLYIMFIMLYICL